MRKQSALLLGIFSAASYSEAADLNYGKRPNILIAVADDQSYPHAGAYGCPWVNTPGFDRVASEGLKTRTSMNVSWQGKSRNIRLAG